jgi:MFS transporter, FSR family, fosmidomycin resistance protein
MSQATEVLSASRVSDVRTIGVVSAAHFVSHYYILVLPPLFAFVRADYGVSYTELGLALAAFNVVSAALQTPAGFLVDWLGARILLMIGLLLGALAFAIVGLVDSFWVLVAMFGVAGVGNTVYHPADYALLSHRVSPERIGHAYSVHTFAGMLGSAAAPVSLLLMQSVWGWRGAFIGTALLGFTVAAAIAFVRDDAPVIAPPRASKSGGPDGWRLLFSAPILMNLAFFALLALMSGGLQYYSVVALGALHATSIATANTALTGYLLFAAFGVLLGGLVAARTPRHNLVAVGGLIATTLLAVIIAMFDLGSALLVLTMSITGLFTGVIMPSRDMIVREITPPGSFGKVFGFVTTGFNIGGIISPLMFGAVMDRGSPQLVFLLVAAFSAIAIVTVTSGQKRMT